KQQRVDCSPKVDHRTATTATIVFGYDSEQVRDEPGRGGQQVLLARIEHISGVQRVVAAATVDQRQRRVAVARQVLRGVITGARFAGARADPNYPVTFGAGAAFHAKAG